MGDTSNNRVAESVHGSTGQRTTTVPVSVEESGRQQVARFLPRKCSEYSHCILQDGRSCECGKYDLERIDALGRDGHGSWPQTLATLPVNHPGDLQPVPQPAASPPFDEDACAVCGVCGRDWPIGSEQECVCSVAEPAKPYNHVVEIVRLDGELARERALVATLKDENKRLRDQLTAVARRAIDDIQATPLRTWIRSFFGASV